MKKYLFIFAISFFTFSVGIAASYFYWPDSGPIRKTASIAKENGVTVDIITHETRMDIYQIKDRNNNVICYLAESVSSDRKLEMSCLKLNRPPK